MPIASIDFVRELLESKLHENQNSINYFSDSDIKIYSFYEELTEDEEVNRYVEKYKDLVSQQNKSGLIGFGIVSTTSDSGITNIRSAYINPFEWNITIRCSLANRDIMLTTLKDLINKCKGHCFDIAELSNGKLKHINTLLDDRDSVSQTNLNDVYIGQLSTTKSLVTLSAIENRYATLLANTGVNTLSLDIDLGTKVYFSDSTGKLCHFEKRAVESVNTWVDLDTDNEHYLTFTKYKLDMSLNDFKVTEPFTLDSTKYITITFNGSSTLCNESVKLGNNLVRFLIKRDKVLVGSATPFTFNAGYELLEPLEMPSGLSVDNLQSQLRSNFFKVNTHNNSETRSINYSFLYDTTQPMLEKWFEYSRYGIANLDNQNALTQNSVSPNIIYSIKEIWSSWGVVKVYTFPTKIDGDIDIKNGEDDTLVMSVNMALQGVN